MGACCCTSSPAVVEDPDAPGAVSAKKEKKLQKQRLNSGESSDGLELSEKQPKMKSKKARKMRAAMDEEEDAEGDFSESNDAAVAAAAAEAEKAAAAEAERAAQEAAAAAAAAEAKAAEEAAKARAAAEARAHAAQLNSALASRIASKPRTRAQNLHTAAALELSDTAAFDAFVKWEDEVQKAASALLGRVPNKLSKKLKASAKANGDGSLFTLLAMEEQTRNQGFVNALQTQSLSRTLQGRALRCARLSFHVTLAHSRCRALPTMSLGQPHAACLPPRRIAFSTPSSRPNHLSSRVPTTALRLPAAALSRASQGVRHALRQCGQ